MLSLAASMSVFRRGSRRYAVSGTKKIIAGRHNAQNMATKLKIHGTPILSEILPARMGVKNAPPKRARFVTAMRLPRSYYPSSAQTLVGLREEGIHT